MNGTRACNARYDLPNLSASSSLEALEIDHEKRRQDDDEACACDRPRGDRDARRARMVPSVIGLRQ